MNSQTVIAVNKPVHCWSRLWRVWFWTSSSFVSVQTWWCQMCSVGSIHLFRWLIHPALDPTVSHYLDPRREMSQDLPILDRQPDFPWMNEFYKNVGVRKTFLSHMKTSPYLFWSSVIWLDLAAKLFISLIEFLNSLRSLWRAWGFTELPDVVVDSCDWEDWEDVELLAVIWCKRCDDVVLATREDVVVDELFNT